MEILRLENIIYVEVKKKKLEVFKISYDTNKIVIFVYNLVLFDLRLQRQIIKFYHKVLNIQSVVQRFGLCERYVIYFLRTMGIVRVVIRNQSLKTSKYPVSLLCFKKHNILLFYITIYKWILCINFVKFCNFIKLLWDSFNDCLTSFGRQLKKKIILNVKLKKISGLVVFNLLSVYLENVIFFLLGCFLSVRVSNALLLSGCYLEIGRSNKFIKQDFRYSFYTIFLSMLYGNSKLVADYLSVSIKKQKNHFKVLKFFTELLTFYFVRNLFATKGIQIRVTGKLGGKMRRSKFHYKIGKVQLHTFKVALSYTMSLSYTKFGVLSVKVWLICK